MKNLLLSLPFLFIVLLTAACSSPTPTPTEVQLPALPTPDVPPIEEIDHAIETWENSDTSDYYIEVDVENQAEKYLIRLAVEGDQIRVAQRLDANTDGSWGEPYSIPHDEAQEFTVDALLMRIRTDALGEGPALYNMITSFHETLGYPAVAHAEALPTYTDSGTLELNRQFNYEILTQVRALMEDTFGTEDQPIFTYTRSNGPQAWCDNLRIYPDGSSIYLDDCRDEFWQIPTPESRLVMLDELRDQFGELDETRVEGDQTQHLVIPGTGHGTPDTDLVDEAWQLTAELHEILSEPTGLGLVMSYVFKGEFFGYDVFNKVTLPSQFSKSGDLKTAVLTPDGVQMAFSDDNGLSSFNIKTQASSQLLPSPENGVPIPRSWSNSGLLLVSTYPENEGEPVQHGWLSLENSTWHDLPVPDGVNGYGCDTGVSWSPDGEQLAITGIGYGSSCNISPGLSVVDIEANAAQVVVSPLLTPLAEGDEALLAGAHTPAWSPDGNWIAFGLDQDPNESANFPTRLYRAHPDGTNLTPLTNNSNGFATHPVWAQDGSLYYGLSGVDADLDGLYYYLPSENSHTLLLPGTGIHPLSISPDGEFLVYEQQQALKIWRVRLQETIAEISAQEDQQPSFSGWVIVEGSQ